MTFGFICSCVPLPPSPSTPSAGRITSRRHRSATLNSVARHHAADMARRNSLDHDGFYRRMDGYTRAAENVAYGCSNADRAYRLWAASSGHRQNMLMGGLTHYGLASAMSANGRRYWVLELAGERPPPVLMRSAAPHRHAKKRSHPAHRRAK